MEKHVEEFKFKESMNDKDSEFIRNLEETISQTQQQQHEHEQPSNSEDDQQFAVDIEKAIKLSLQSASEQLPQQQDKSTKIVDSFEKNFQEKEGTTSEIKGWKYDPSCKAIIIKRDHGRCKYYYHTYDLLKLPKTELR